MVRLGTDAADARRQVGHVLGEPTDAELLEAAQLRDLQVGVLHLAFVVEEDVDLAVPLQPGDGIDGDPGHHVLLSTAWLAAVWLSAVWTTAVPWFALPLPCPFRRPRRIGL